MKFKDPFSPRTYNVKIERYLVDWNKVVKRGGKKNFGKFQYEVKRLLKPYWEGHVVLEEFTIPRSGNLSIDLVNLTKKICVEASGVQHEELAWCHKNKYDFIRQLRNDNVKELWSKINGFGFFEIYEGDELNEELLIRLGII